MRSARRWRESLIQLCLKSNHNILVNSQERRGALAVYSHDRDHNHLGRVQFPEDDTIGNI